MREIESVRLSVKVPLLQLGSKKFGEPEAAMRAQITAIVDVDKPNAFVARILDVATWDELLQPH